MEEAFKSWTVFMDNFALSTKMLTNAKRLNVLLMPLVQRNVTSESEVKSKLVCSTIQSKCIYLLDSSFDQL